MTYRRDFAAVMALIGLAVVLAVAHATWFVPQAIGIACLHGTGPAALCALRTGMNALTNYAVLGTLALGLGIVAFATGRVGLCIAAIAAGLVGIVFANVSWGMLGGVLGGWGWLRGADQG